MEYKLGILGLGKMGGSILNGVLASGLYKPEDICLYTPHPEGKNIAEGIHMAKDEHEVFASSKLILLAVKPQMYTDVLKHAEGLNFEGKAIMSLAPGKSVEYLEGIFQGAAVVRAMPNTPASILCGTTTLYAPKHDELFDMVKQVFECIGSASVLDKEEQIDEAIPLNGSMPAYLYYFAQAFINKGIEYGIDENIARQLAGSAIIGSARMILESDESLDTLINNVCSKKGSTIEGLNRLAEQDFQKIIEDCYDACVARSKELSKV